MNPLSIAESKAKREFEIDLTLHLLLYHKLYILSTIIYKLSSIYGLFLTFKIKALGFTFYMLSYIIKEK